MAASIFSNSESFGAFARRVLSTPKMDISLDQHSQGKIYTTLDALSGEFEFCIGVGYDF